MAKLISKTYGEALFELAVEEAAADGMLEEITGIRKVLCDNPEYLRFLTNPRIPAEEKVKTTTEIFTGRVSKEVVGFISLIIRKGRSDALFDILDYFISRMKEYKGIGVAYVITPQVLKEEKKERIREKLLSTTSFKEMEMHYEINPDLLGGMQIRIGDRVVDSSIQTKLNQLQKELLSLQV
ncbi:MAG: ATP synthase F1 subunit delta [Lachnospiraceae bacterium]|nr:ATP synthase F1 subunit delta [Lachnospiraceae bacterium]